MDHEQPGERLQPSLLPWPGARLQETAGSIPACTWTVGGAGYGPIVPSPATDRAPPAPSQLQSTAKQQVADAFLPAEPRAAYNACGCRQDCGRDTGQEAPFLISSKETPALRQAAGEPSLADGEGAQTAIGAADGCRVALRSQHCITCSIGPTAQPLREIFGDQSSGGILADPFGGVERVVASPDCCVPTVPQCQQRAGGENRPIPQLSSHPSTQALRPLSGFTRAASPLQRRAFETSTGQAQQGF